MEPVHRVGLRGVLGHGPVAECLGYARRLGGAPGTRHEQQPRVWRAIVIGFEDQGEEEEDWGQTGLAVVCPVTNTDRGIPC